MYTTALFKIIYNKFLNMQDIIIPISVIINKLKVSIKFYKIPAAENLINIKYVNAIKACSLIASFHCV